MTTGDEMEGPWFCRYRSGETVVTQWEFSLDDLYEDQAEEVDRRIRALVEEFLANRPERCL